MYIVSASCSCSNWACNMNVFCVRRVFYNQNLMNYSTQATILCRKYVFVCCSMFFECMVHIDIHTHTHTHSYPCNLYGSVLLMFGVLPVAVADALRKIDAPCSSKLVCAPLLVCVCNMHPGRNYFKLPIKLGRLVLFIQVCWIPLDTASTLPNYRIRGYLPM